MQVSPQRLLLPLAISFSLTGIGVLLIYYVNKKKSDNQKRHENGNSEQVIEMTIPREYVPLVVGRGGTVIDCIQKTTKTKIKFLEEKNVDHLKRTCTITGDAENIKLAKEKIKRILTDQPVVETYEINVPYKTIMRMMERGGAILNHIQNSSNAKVIYEANSPVADSNSMRRVILKGTSQQISNAFVQIEDQVRQDKKLQSQVESSALNRTPRVRTSPSHLVESKSREDTLTKEIFGSLGDGSLIEVFVSAAENPSQFYIQVTGHPHTSLDGLVKEMTEYYDCEENREIHSLKNITVGKVVAAKFSVDNKWYRGEVIDDLQNNLYNVYFVDFGDKEKVDHEGIFELRTDFLSLRYQAIECSLAGVKPREEEWSMAACETFFLLSSVAQWQPCMAKITGYKKRAAQSGSSKREGSPIPLVELYEKRGDQLLSIGQELIKRNVASPAENEPSSATDVSVSLPRNRNSSQVQNPDLGYSVEALAKSPGLQVPKKIESIDLSAPLNIPANPSQSFLENERNPQVMQNGNSNGNPHGKIKPRVKNPFKIVKPVRHYNVMPAGIEDELTDDDDGMEMDLYPEPCLLAKPKNFEKSQQASLLILINFSINAEAGARYIAIPIDNVDVIELSPVGPTNPIINPSTSGLSQRYPRQASPIAEVYPHQTRSSEPSEPITRHLGAHVLDYVDFGAHTGPNGAFSWYADFPSHH
ncbi:hypothetical protein QAD02_016465 [Eretmocerus hayati]|uniref:Uncharacterized protein n=1 Tax=Eretmocerus hayati TaxID=131215 RepID=A0ACC2PB63_9HYME|nr:hypothetical protein QAD02_016465 [Eretmocerus hayati]